MIVISIIYMIFIFRLIAYSLQPICLSSHNKASVLIVLLKLSVRIIKTKILKGF